MEVNFGLVIFKNLKTIHKFKVVIFEEHQKVCRSYISQR